MNALVNNDETKPSVAIKLLVEQHGAWRVLRAFLALFLAPEQKAARLGDLSPHMRRDMGLPPIEPPCKYWDLR